MPMPNRLRNHFALSVAAMLCAALCASSRAQSPAQSEEQAGPTFRATIKLIQVNVVVQDKHGRAVTDLRRDECELLDNGKRQPLALFILEDAANPREPVVAKGVFTNQLLLASGARSGYSVILLDWLNTSWADQAYARRQTLRMLAAIGQRDRVALYVLGRELRVVHEFTGDIEALRRMVTSEHGLVAFDDSGATSMADASVGPSWLDSEISPELFSRQDQFFIERRILDTLKAFEAIAAHLAAVPGRKSLIWVSGGFPATLGISGPGAPSMPASQETGPSLSRASIQTRVFSEELNRAFARLNNADVAVYPIDARGLTLSAKAWTNIATMQELADRTGGRAYYNRNDLDVAIRSALDDVNISYTLGYYAPPAGESKAGTHRLRVIVHRPDVIVRHRREYLEQPAAPAKRSAEVKSDQLRAWTSPIDATALGVGARAVRSGNKLALKVLLDPAALALTQKGGRRAGKVDILAGFRKPDGSLAAPPTSNSLVLNMREQTYENAAREGLKLDLALPIPPEASAIRLLVRDTGSSKLGTLTIPLQSISTE